MADVKHDKQDQTDVGDKEIRRVPWNEGREALREDDQDVEEQPVPREVWLPYRLVGQCVAGDVAPGQRTHEPDMAAINACPGDEPRDGRDIEQPVEDGGAIIREIKEAQKAKGCRTNDRDIWHSALGCPCENLRGRTFGSEANENAAAGVDIGVCSGKDDEEKDRIDKTGKGANACEFCGDDKGRGRGVGSGVEETWVVVWDKKSDEEYAEDEEEEDSVECLSDCGGDSFAGILSLTSSDGNQFGALIGEASLDQHGPESNKLGEGSGGVEKVGSKSSWISPGVEAKIAILARSSINADTED